MKKALLKILIGLITLLVPLYLIFPGMPLETWGNAVWELIKGGITLIILFIGIVLIILGLTEIKN
ncbi:MAG: hypothetical protein U9Q99_01790 [Nanoarchaeota archaeon]|nr:hypothetical protein [Nanoarchaeota archaeon]